jgi:phosphomannomutase
VSDGLMISVSGIRGRVGAGLTPEVVATYAAGFGAWAAAQRGAVPEGDGRRPTIVVGRDSRVSGPMFHRAVIAALQSVGCSVIDVGLAPTPTIQLAVESHQAAGGLAITASHNPIEWNALKFIGPAGLFLSGPEGADMRAATARGIPRATWDQLGDVWPDHTAIDRHLAAVLELPYLDVDAIRSRRLHVALDCVRGAGGVIMPALLERLGCRVSAIEAEPDGHFPRPPEPVAENLGALEALVKETGADIGFAVDPDVDRLALVDETGHAIGEDYTLALATALVLSRDAGSTGPVVTNLSTSRIVDDVAAERGVAVVRTPVGEVNVALRMLEVHAPVGGEGNGGVILPALHLGRDGPAAAALILQLLTDAGRERVSQLVARWPRYAIVKEKLPAARDGGGGSGLEATYNTLRGVFADATVDTQDGLRLAWPDRWVHVRPSGTEPVVRVIAEAPTEDAARTLIARARQVLGQGE